MRTRFLNTDFFTPSTETFLHLPPPPPPLDSGIHFNFSTVLLTLTADSSFVPSPSLDNVIPELPIQSALSKFLSDVVPLQLTLKDSDILFGGKLSPAKNVEEVEVRNKSDRVRQTKEYENELGPTEFEIPQLDLSLVESPLCGMENIQFLPYLLQTENQTNITMAGIECPVDAQERVYLAVDIISSYDIGEESNLLEDDGNIQDQNYIKKFVFPLLEVDEISLGISTNLSMEEEFLVFLHNIKPWRWTQIDTVDTTELLGARDIDLVNYHTDYNMKQYEESESSEMKEMKLFLDMDFITITGASLIEEISVTHQATSYFYSYSLVDPVHFLEFQFPDMDLHTVADAFSEAHLIDEPEVSDYMMKEKTIVRKIDDVFVSHELTLVDNTLRSLPVPVLQDHEYKRFMCDIQWMDDIKTQPLSTSDEIYLDWHLLGEDKWDSHIHIVHQKVLEVTNNYCLKYDYEMVDGENWMSDTLFVKNYTRETNIVESKEPLDLMISDSPVHSNNLIDEKLAKRELSSSSNVDRARLVEKCTSNFSDLEFFLNPQKANGDKRKEFIIKTLDTHAQLLIAPPQDSIFKSASSGSEFSQWNIKLHQVELSDNLLVLIDNFQKCYLAILENIPEVKKRHWSFQERNKVKLLGLTMHELMDCIKASSSQASSNWDENVLAILTLFAIKQMARYICFYGIHVAQLYTDNLCKNLECLKFRLCFLQSLITDAHRQAERDITRLHPSLSIIQEILCSSMLKSNLKALIVAEKIFWWTLKRLLISMGKTFNELQIPIDQNNGQYNVSTRAPIDSVQWSDCLLVCPKDATTAIPFDKFRIVIECGGSHSSSRISTLLSTVAGFPCLHFIHVNLEEHSVPEALCEDSDMHMPQSIGFFMDEQSFSILSKNKNLSIRKLEELFNFIPSIDYAKMTSLKAVEEAEVCSVPVPVSCTPDTNITERDLQTMPCEPNQLIVVNTKNIEKEVIISRRTTYQRILSLESEGLQVVERDSDLPVDVIIGASMCLVWYDSRNIKTKETPSDEASSCLTLWVQHIATNILTMLSFAFSGCYLVFEGDSSFIFAIMESSDGLNAAAASLGMDMQIFYSHSFELTDELILNCIRSTMKLFKGIYPRMPESETIGESFLSKFPSINPISAHSIVSLGGTMGEFLESSYDEQTNLIRNSFVPEESITLLAALCKYGEREDSKSGMTDCSSSVSPAPDSDSFHCKTELERRKRKSGRSPPKFELPSDNFMEHGPFSASLHSSLSPYRLLKQFKYEITDSPEIFPEFETPCSTSKDKSHSKGEGPEWGMRGSKHWHDLCKSEAQSVDLIGEVIDFKDRSFDEENYISMLNCSSFKEMKNDPAARSSKIARRLNFSCNHPNFLSASEINYDLDVGSPIKKINSFGERHPINPHKDLSTDFMPSIQQKDLVREVGKAIRSSNVIEFQEETLHFGGTPFRNAICSSELQQGSPWTIEFLNRIREKSRLRQNSVSCAAASPDYPHASGAYPRNIKRKSPSILDFYKYQGASCWKRGTEYKKQKHLKDTMSSSMGDKNQIPVQHSWTPPDKRSRRTLSFVTSGSGSQSRLVWRSEGDV